MMALLEAGVLIGANPVAHRRAGEDGPATFGLTAMIFRAVARAVTKPDVAAFTAAAVSDRLQSLPKGGPPSGQLFSF